MMGTLLKGRELKAIFIAVLAIFAAFLAVPFVEIIYQALRCLHVSCLQVQKANLQIQKLRRRIREDRLIYQAKLILIEQYHWSEEKAHHYIEQLSMNSSQKKAAVAQMIVDKSMIET